VNVHAECHVGVEVANCMEIHHMPHAVWPHAVWLLSMAPATPQHPFYSSLEIDEMHSVYVVLTLTRMVTWGLYLNAKTSLAALSMYTCKHTTHINCKSQAVQ